MRILKFFLLAVILLPLWVLIELFSEVLFPVPFHSYVDQNIDDIVYAPPGEEAKNFDYFAHLATFPHIEYEKIEYPVQETFTYRFNGYMLTVDVPRGFFVYTLPLKEEPRVLDSKGIEDSCMSVPGDVLCANNPVLWMLFGSIQSAPGLCISPLPPSDWCRDGISVSPEKPVFRGMNLKEVQLIQAKEDTKRKAEGISDTYTYFNKTRHGLYLRVIDSQSYWSYSEIFLSEGQALSTTVADNNLKREG